LTKLKHPNVDRNFCYFERYTIREMLRMQHKKMCLCAVRCFSSIVLRRSLKFVSKTEHQHCTKARDVSVFSENKCHWLTVFVLYFSPNPEQSCFSKTYQFDNSEVLLCCTCEKAVQHFCENLTTFFWKTSNLPFHGSPSSVFFNVGASFFHFILTPGSLL